MKKTLLPDNFFFQSVLFNKHLLFSLVSFLIINISFGQSSSSCGEGEMVELHSPSTTGGNEAITIDGLDNETAWARVTPSPILSLTTGKNQPGYAAQWRGMWDNTYLYIFVQVTDPSIYPGNGPTPNFYQNDAVEIFTDANNTKVSNNYDNGDHQYGFSLGTAATDLNPTGITQGPTNKTLGVAGINYARVISATGYTMEIEIPWTVIGGGVAPNPAVGVGKLIGFDIAIDDDNNGSTRDAQYSWHTSEVNEYADASAFATVPLVNCPPPPLILTALSSNLTCSRKNDGVIVAQASGGISPYTYQLLKGNLATGIDTLNVAATNGAATFSNLPAGNYTVTVTDEAIPTASTYDTSITLSSFVNALTVASDVSTICAGSPANLTASGGTNYLWTANPPGATAGLSVAASTTANPTVTPTVTTIYTVTTLVPVNLILNPGFESGNIGFTSDYTYFPASQLPTVFTQEVYGIVHQSDSFDIKYNPFFDHTTGTIAGQMLVASGAVQNDPTYGTSPIIPSLARVWSQTVTVQPNTLYTFSYYLRDGGATSPAATIQTKVTGNPANTTTVVGNAAATTSWVQNTYTWNSGSNTSATITLYDVSTNTNGFAIDDLSFITACSLGKDTTITVNKADTVSISNDTTICPGNNAAINFIGTPGATVTYTKKDLKTGITTTPPTITLDATNGTYSLLSTFTDSTVFTLVNVSGGTLNCPRDLSNADTINVIPLPTATISGDTSLCSGAATNITFNGTKGATVTYTTNNGADQTVVLDPVTGIDIISTGAVTANTVYTLVSVATAGTPSCPQNITGTATVQIGNPPTATISGDTSICAGSPATTITFTGTKGATVTYIVNEGSNQTIALDPLTGIATLSTGALSATTTYTLVNVFLSAICVQSLNDSAKVIVNPLPVADFTISQPALCAQNTLNFINASSSNVNTWTWNFGDASSSASSSLPNPSHMYATATSYNISLQVKDINGCSSAALDTTVIINPLPQPGFTIPLICIASGAASINLTATNSGAATVNTWKWDFDDGTSQSGSTVTYNYTNGGAHTITLIGTSTAGCIDSLTEFDTAYNVPVAKDSIENNTGLCSNMAVNLINESSVNGGYGSISKVEIYWDYVNNPTPDITDNSPVAGGVYTHSYPALPTDNTYGVIIDAFSGNGCTTTPDTTFITVHGSPTVLFASPASVCQETAPFTLTGGAEISGPADGMGNYTGNGVSGSIFSPAQAGAGTFPIIYTYTTASGCSDTAMQNISVFATPLVSYGTTQSVLFGDSITLAPVSGAVVGLKYQWMPAVYLNNDTLAAPICKPTDSVTYNILITSPDGACQYSTTLFVQVLNDFKVPNTFTPNNDGINDTWVIEELPKFPIQWVQIFDRYGQLLFESHGYSKPWDGTYKGKPLESGTYYYIIELGGVIAPKTGYVTILR